MLAAAVGRLCHLGDKICGENFHLSYFPFLNYVPPETSSLNLSNNRYQALI
jgi:hypothetical protein